MKKINRTSHPLSTIQPISNTFSTNSHKQLPYFSKPINPHKRLLHHLKPPTKLSPSTLIKSRSTTISNTISNTSKRQFLLRDLYKSNTVKHFNTKHKQFLIERSFSLYNTLYEEYITYNTKLAESLIGYKYTLPLNYTHNPNIFHNTFYTTPKTTTKILTEKKIIKSIYQKHQLIIIITITITIIIKNNLKFKLNHQEPLQITFHHLQK